ncbi:acetyl-CoA carboxylase family protein [Actinokineospora bangkokensis]|uniref:Carbamoyl-phosphate synthase large subunit n=1 Tax=Actinokineospora bangkokensis TaxID=1193682 RepID=A0A1Q9LNK7_9PSEU|nr:carboxyl transferase domain-containing protein [Actinokineospora bangkokensis]OLR93579.1 carbamoyl-phosphate synthase large subunit [Actinokineospora bangkokensis]
MGESRARVLVANRGEIAVRVARAAASIGVGSVAVFTGDDRDARHTRVADEAHPVPDYLDVDALLAVAERSGAGLVHPGYGFLSESAEFAQRCADAGLVFAGPAPRVLRLLGDKARARELAAGLGVPVLPATPGGVDPREAAGFAAGGSVVVKAVAGGGGRGMRVVHPGEDLAFAMDRCRSEAERAFGGGELYLERYLPDARHVEVQVVGDGRDVVHVGDRECSVQRRHQKLIEVAPCTTVPDDVREQLFDAALRIAGETAYSGLGTVEFLVAGREWYFLEVNPRVQVEHTVTEAVTGLDLVAAQLGIALGGSLADVGVTPVPPPRGLAVQCRVNLEEPQADGSARATSGVLDEFEVPTGPGVRVDTGAHRGARTTARYDSLLAKVVTHVPHTDLARAADAAGAALADFRVAGPGTNLGFLRAVLRHPVFCAGQWTTTTLDALAAELVPHGASAASADLVAPFAGSVVDVPARVGAHVAAGQPLVVVEAMKMEHVLVAGVSGTVVEVRPAAGTAVADGDLLVRLDADDEQAEAVATEEAVDVAAVRADLAEVLERHRVGLDEARGEAVARRHATGHRTARENVADLCDDGTFVEYGALAVAAQRQRRTVEELIAKSPADGMVTGVGEVGGVRCAVLAYDYTVFAGTQGVMNHRKTDRLLDLAAAQRLPVVLFAEGGGGRPGDTDTTSVSALDVPTFATMARLNGVVPSVGIASGRCFAGNAALLGCCDVVVATADATIGMGGPAMIEGGGLGVFAPEEVGPVAVQVPNGVVDVLVEDEAAAVAVAKRYLSYFRGPDPTWECADQRELRHVVPENRVRAYDVRRVLHLLADTGSVLELRPSYGVGVLTALARVEGRPVGVIANNPGHLGGAIDAPAADKAARFLQLCDAHGLPVLSLCDTPGFMVGPDAERTATVRRFSRLFVTGANLSVPVLGVVLRKAYGLGAMAMLGGSVHVPVATLAWPTGEVGGMGLEGAVRLAFRRELAAIEDPAARQEAYDAILAEAYRRGKAVNAASVLELDDVIDPADTRRWITRALPPTDRPAAPRRVDPW